jgi:uncharacterized protein (DUF433 family)
MKHKIINIDPDILNGIPVFYGTRVPIETLFIHLQKGIPLDEFLDDFPTVKKVQALEILGMAEKMFSSKKVESLYENIVG